jgi:hypothetical protein
MDPALVKKFIDMKKNNFDMILTNFMNNLEKMKPNDRAVVMNELQIAKEWILNINDIEKKYPKAAFTQQKTLYEDLARNAQKLDQSIDKIKKALPK